MNVLRCAPSPVTKLSFCALQERIARKRQKELEEAIRFESFFNVGRESLAACAFQGLGSPSNGTADGLAF